MSGGWWPLRLAFVACRVVLPFLADVCGGEPYTVAVGACWEGGGLIPQALRSPAPTLPSHPPSRHGSLPFACGCADNRNTEVPLAIGCIVLWLLCHHVLVVPAFAFRVPAISGAGACGIRTEQGDRFDNLARSVRRTARLVDTKRTIPPQYSTNRQIRRMAQAHHHHR